MKHVAWSMLVLGGALAACGPTKLQVQPSDVVNVTVRPRSGQLLFCPGDPFQVEVLAKMKDGTTCSSADETRGCLGEEGVIDPKLVRIKGSSGGMKDREQLVWLPPDDPLATAGEGLDLVAWLEGTVEGKSGKSDSGDVHLKPVYQCQNKGQTFRAQRYGAPGPTVEVAITKMSTPYYPNAALIRVEVPSQRYAFHFISPNADTTLYFASGGGHGRPGSSGSPGSDGQDGQDGSSCQNGGNGSDGSDGGPGGPGGDGGDGGLVRIALDEAFADELRGRVRVESLAGQAGRGGYGGRGGRGGDGGDGGAATEDCPRGQDGTDGRDGRQGPDGQPGRDGKPGPPPEVVTAPRDVLFARELSVIKAIEAKKARK